MTSLSAAGRQQDLQARTLGVAPVKQVERFGTAAIGVTRCARASICGDAPDSPGWQARCPAPTDGLQVF
jgi:hypothetical protein